MSKVFGYDTGNKELISYMATLNSPSSLVGISLTNQNMALMLIPATLGLTSFIPKECLHKD